MRQSMTGFARFERLEGDVQIVWQLKSVNHRFLDLAIRLPDGYAELEIAAATLLRKYFARGRIEGHVLLSPVLRQGFGWSVDEQVLGALLQVEERLQSLGGGRGRMSMECLMRWPGLVCEQRGVVAQGAQEAIGSAILDTLEEAAGQLLASRQGEGRNICLVLESLLDQVAGVLVRLKGILPTVRGQHQERLRERLAEFAGAGVDEDRLGQEIVFFLNRMDVAEELDRLMIHIGEMRSVLSSSGAVGRRLDFLCQELNREANTFCSKSQDSELSRCGVDLKTFVEQLREQVQNLE
ncbi:MAG: YicC family protein [Magnetococcus sp. DMHC-6]